VRKPKSWLIGIGGLIGLFGAFFITEAAVHVEHPVEQKRPVLACIQLRGTWNGDPVYALENKSDEPLRYITVSSWSEQILPIIGVGKTNGAPNLERTTPFPPPVLLPGHQVAWFAGPRVKAGAPRYFVVTWLMHGDGYSTVVQTMH
jgi:hypothetical protein